MMNDELRKEMNEKLIESGSEIQHSAFSVQHSKIALILLAGGAARRMENQPKLLLEFRGESLLRRAARTALESVCRPICVVLGANAERLRREIADLPVEITVCENWADGLSSSLKTGLNYLLQCEPQIAAVCVTLADQPLITTAVINRLAGVFERGEQNPLVVCEYEKTVGVPAIFPKSLFADLMNLSGDSGAKAIIEKHIESAEKIFAPEAAFDVDSPEDYQRLAAME